MRRRTRVRRDDGRASDAEAPGHFLAKVDHLVYATPDLALGIDTRAAARCPRRRAGSIPDWGSECAHRARSIDIPRDHRSGSDQPKPATPRRFGIDELTAPRLTLGRRGRPGRVRGPRPPRWRHARRCDRRQPQASGRRGARLALYRSVRRAGGPPHSACHRLGHVAASRGHGRAWCEAVALRAEHPDASAFQKMLTHSVSICLSESGSTKTALIVTLEGPKGGWS